MDSSLRNKWRQDGFVIVKEVFDPKRTNRLKSICEFIDKIDLDMEKI